MTNAVLVALLTFQSLTASRTALQLIVVRTGKVKFMWFFLISCFARSEITTCPEHILQNDPLASNLINIAAKTKIVPRGPYP